MEGDLSKIGSLWRRESKDGNRYLAGSITLPHGGTVKVLVFANTYKEEGSKQPDFNIMLKPEEPEQPAKTATTPQDPFA